eukprot:465627_1
MPNICSLVRNCLLFAISVNLSPPSAEASNIVWSSWVATEYYDGDELVSPIPGSVITLIFEEGRLGGSGGCNSYSGTGTYLDDDSFRFDAGIHWTEMACSPWALNEQEEAYLQNFGTGVEYSISDDVLELRDGDSKSVIAHFAPVSSARAHSSSTEQQAGSAPTESTSAKSLPT